MFTRHELLSSPEYWFEEAQNELYRQVVEYKEKKRITQTELAVELGVTKGYVSQILKGEFNYTLKKLIEISLAIGQVPRVEYTSLAQVIEEDAKTSFIEVSTTQPQYFQIKLSKSTDHNLQAA
jgi:transcriptional regulator with XRE-family HTH domain